MSNTDIVLLKKKLVESYNAMCKKYLQSKPPVGLSEFVLAKLMVFLAATKVVAEFPKILDLGSGTGDNAIILQEHGAKITCVDNSEGMIQLCAERGLSTRLEDFYHLSDAPASVDGILMSFSFLHVPKNSAQQLLNDILKSLKSGGILMLIVFEGQGEGFERKTKYPFARYFSYYSEKELKNLAESLKLEIVDVETFVNSPRNVISLIARK